MYWLFTLAYLIWINQSFVDRVFPDVLKISIVKPYKKGDKNDLNDYRILW